LLSGIHPYQQPDDEKMLDMIERGIWPGWKSAITWSKVSDDAKDLVRKMMNPISKERPTVNVCLEHPWIQGNAPKDDLGDIKEALKSYQAKKKMRAAVLGVIATNKMKQGLLALDTLPSNTASPTPTATSTTAPEKVSQSKPLTVSKDNKNTKYDTLTIKIIAGKDLAAKDVNGKSDPYCVLWCGAEKFKTKMKTKTLSPHWDETFQVPYSKCHGKSLDFECWDTNLLMRDEFMGEFSVNVDQIPLGKPDRKWYNLMPRSGETKKKKSNVVSGAIEVEFSKV